MIKYDFSDFFKDYKDDYIIVGGVATVLNQRRFGFASKATLDIDLIVLTDQTLPFWFIG